MKNFYWDHIHRSDTSASYRWGLALCSVIALMPITGSIMSGFYSLLCLLGLIYIFHDWQNITLLGKEKLIALVFAIYFVITLVFAIAHENPWDGIAIIANNAGFIATLFLLPVARKFSLGNRDWIASGVIAGGLIMLVAAPVEFFLYPGNRVEFNASNPLVLSWMAGSLVLLSIPLVVGYSGVQQAVAALALFGSLLALIGAGGRGPILALFITLLVALFIYIRRIRFRSLMIFAAVGLLFVAAGMQLSKSNRTLQVMQERFSTAYEQLLGNDKSSIYATSGNIRMVYYTRGWQAFLEAPLAGHGRQNVMRDTVSNSGDIELARRSHTHLHNAYLTEAVASGILGVLALFAVTLTPIIAAFRTNARTMEMAVGFTIFTNLCFMTNIGFYHDVMVFFFCTVVVFLNRQGGKPVM